MAGASEGRTIAALSSSPGGGDRAVIRLSGPDAFAIARAALSEDSPGCLPDRRGLVEAELFDGVGRQPVLILAMPGPRSFTREDVIELHVSGAEPLAARALARVLELGAAAAGPGEFTRRAFENGRVDLTRAEAVLELVSAETEGERRAAALLLEGGLADRVGELRSALADLGALCVASLDFDEGDTGEVPTAALEARFRSAREGLEQAASWEETRVPIRGLPRVVLVGAPNAGKSSLLNALAGRAHALVAPHPGTTRDSLEVELDLGGRVCLLVDAPGLDPSARGVDGLAQERARRGREAADLFLWVVDATRPDPEAAEEEAARIPDGAPRLLVWNKLDVRGAAPSPPPPLARCASETLGVSAATGAGLAGLVESAGRALGVGAEGGDRAAVSRELAARHRGALRDAQRHLDRAGRALRAGEALDLVAEELLLATAALDAISGETTPEDLLDRVFARFCIGK